MLTYEIMKEQCEAVAHNPVLVKFSTDAGHYSGRQYSIFFHNMRMWLTPTIVRLREGLALIEAENSPRLAPMKEAFALNIVEESGYGISAYSHASLFVQSCRTFHRVVYGGDMKKARITQATRDLNDKSMLLFSRDVFEMFGASLAQELHALPQLELMYAGHHTCAQEFKPFLTDEWRLVDKFFDLHLDGTEARHAEDINLAIWELVDEDGKRQRLEAGFEQMIALLKGFWTDLEKEIEKSDE